MLSLPGRQPNEDITLLNTYYVRSQKQEDGSYKNDYMTIIYRDNKRQKKFHCILENPEYEFYFLKPEVRMDHNCLFIEEDKVDQYSVPYRKLARKIAELEGNEDFYYDNLQTGNFKANQVLHHNYRVFNSVMDINDHYRFLFDKAYKNEPFKITKSYFDIEVDTIHMKGDFPELGECPVNAISYIYNGKITVFLLRNPDNPLVEEFENELKTNTMGLFKELNDFIIDKVGGIKRAEKFGLDHLSYEILFYDEEICLIQDLFTRINEDEPDFALAWNMAFDIPYLIERCYVLGYDPRDILCHPGFDPEHRVAEYYIDERHISEYAERGDDYKISAHTVYLDQLIHFASRRKGQAAFPNFKLDTAGEIIAGVRKLDYSHITTNISKFPYLDYKMFIFYNIMDTIVQCCIEVETKDIDYVFNKCLINNTRYNKAHRQTIYLVNRATKEFYKDGLIIGNRVPADKKKFAGASVHDPTNNSDRNKLKIGDQSINVMDNLNDFDYKSLYPSTAREYNMAPNTQIGKIIIPDPVHKWENPYNFEYYDRGGQFIEDLTSQNVLEFCHRWFNYPSFMELLEDMKYYFTYVEAPGFYNINNPRDMVTPIPAQKGKLIQMVYKDERLRGKLIPMVTKIVTPRDDYQKYTDDIFKGVY